MQATPARQRATPSITERARRSQIIAAAIDTIVELGYPRASFAQIAKRAGLSSTGLISYHFSTKRALDAAVVADIFERLHDHMTIVMTGKSTPQTALAAYIEGLVGFMKTEPTALQAMMSIVLNGGMTYDGESERKATSSIGDLLRWGQAEGVFRQFDVLVMATTIQRSLDGIPLAQAANPDLDLDVYARELVDLFTAATKLPD